MVDPPYEIMLLIGIFSAVVAAAFKATALCRRSKDGRVWLRILAILGCLYMAIVWAGQLTGWIPVGPIGLSYAVPGIVVLLSLEMVHAILEW